MRKEKDEQVQDALARIPQPVAPPRLHRQIMAQVQAEARAEGAAPQTQIWRQTQGKGWQTEWRQGMPSPASAPATASVVQITRRQTANGTTYYQHTRYD